MRNLTRLSALAGATAGTLVIAGGIAAAAPAPQLSGSYKVTVTRTVSQGLTGQPVGPVGVETWSVGKCSKTTTPCTITLTRTAPSGKTYKLSVTHTKRLRYESDRTFTQTCRGHKGAKITAGWSVLQSTRVVGTHVTSGRIDHFNSSISTTYKLTAAGQAGGCKTAAEVLAGKA
jgi:hypothetical protein